MMATSFAYESPPKTPPWFRANSQGVSPDAEMSFPHNVGGPPRTPETQLMNGLGSPTGAFERELQKTQWAHQSKAAPIGRSRSLETVSPPGQTVTGDDWYVVGPTGNWARTENRPGVRNLPQERSFSPSPTRQATQSRKATQMRTQDRRPTDWRGSKQLGQLREETRRRWTNDISTQQASLMALGKGRDAEAQLLLALAERSQQLASRHTELALVLLCSLPSLLLLSLAPSQFSDPNLACCRVLRRTCIRSEGRMRVGMVGRTSG